MRVGFLERALKPAKKTERYTGVLNNTRERAEAEARSKALSEYFERKKVERYLRHPEWLTADFAFEREINEYLKSRGLKPEPSSAEGCRKH